MTEWTRVSPPPAPYFQGYLDAHKAGCYKMGDGIKNKPPQRYGISTPEFNNWIIGVADYIDDFAKPHRISRDYPPAHPI